MNFSLPDTDGALHSPGDAVATVVVFTCNHCPYALAWHDRLIAVAEDYTPLGVRTLMINPNDSSRHASDGIEVMRQRVEEGDFGLVPYLRDETQAVARAFGAKTTPDVFVLDSLLNVVYRGAPDGDHDNPALNAAFLRDALDEVLAGGRPDPDETEPIGCSIKWLPYGDPPARA